MTARERLIELLYRAHHNASCVMSETGDEDEAITEEADYILANGVTVQRWIPASEPPKESGEYNVMILGGVIPTSLFYSKSENGWYESTDDDHAEPYRITHWMPLPEPPKEEE